MNMSKVDTYFKETEKAKMDFKEALKRLDYADNDLIDSAIFDVMRKERRYVAFLRRLKNEVFKGKGNELEIKTF